MPIVKRGIGKGRLATPPTSSPAVPPPPGSTVSLPQPSYQVQTVAQTRSAFGNTLMQVLKKVLYPSNTYKNWMNYKGTDNVIKLMQRFMKKSKLHNVLTKHDIAGYGEGTLFSLMHDFKGTSFANAGQVKKFIQLQYKEYIEMLGKVTVAAVDDSMASVVGFFMLAPIVFLTLYGNHSMFISVTSPTGMPIKWGVSKQFIKKMFRNLTEMFDTYVQATNAGNQTAMNTAKMRKMFKLLLYYVTAHKLSTT